MKHPRNFFKPLAIGAPAPLRELPVRLERMIHFVPPHIEKLRAKVPELIAQVDVVLGNLEDAIPADAKEAARHGFIAMAKAQRLRRDRPVDAHQRARLALGARRPHRDRRRRRRQARRDHAAEGRRRLGHPLSRPVAGPARSPPRLSKPILIHAILETAEGVNNVEAIASASPRMHGMSLGPADLAASRAMKTTRVGGGHPDYRVLADAVSAGDARRLPAGPLALHDCQDGRRLRGRRHQAVLRPVRRFLRPGGLRGAVPQRLPHGLRRRLDAASLADPDRQARVLARSRRGRVGREDPRRHAGRHRRGHDRRQDAGRRHLEAGQGARSTSPAWSPPRTPTSAAVRV